MDKITYQNPPTDYDITTQTLNHLQDQIDELKTEITTEKKWSADFSNTIFIADDFENYGSWSEEFANKMNITNYRRYYKQGLRFWSGSVNNLKSYVENTILVKETSPADVTAIIMVLGVNDGTHSLDSPPSDLADSTTNALKYIAVKFPNANIYLFFSPIRELTAGRAYRYIAQGASNTTTCFIGESIIWNVDAPSTLYNDKTGSETYSIPTVNGCKRIAQYMSNYFMIGDICPYKLGYIDCNQINSEGQPFNIAGGIYIKLDNTNMHFDFDLVITKAQTAVTYDSSYILLSEVIPECYRGTVPINIECFDFGFSRYSGSVSINNVNQQTTLALSRADGVNINNYNEMHFGGHASIDIGAWTRY